MFAKKPLLGWSCASCDKDITNLCGKHAEFMPWSKMPVRDPNERMSRVGQGFSRMLASLKPEVIEKIRIMQEKYIDENLGAGDDKPE
jgi:hypothetical protein